MHVLGCMRTSTRSLLLVVAQFSSIAVLLVVGPWQLPWWAWLLFTSGIALFLWSAWALGGNFTVMPEPKAGNRVVHRGPYRWLRHPMYTSVILCALAVTCGGFSAWRAMACVVCIGALVLKVHHEEILLAAQHPGYLPSMAGTWRLLPLIW